MGMGWVMVKILCAADELLFIIVLYVHMLIFSDGDCCTMNMFCSPCSEKAMATVCQVQHK